MHFRGLMGERRETFLAGYSCSFLGFYLNNSASIGQKALDFCFSWTEWEILDCFKGKCFRVLANIVCFNPWLKNLVYFLSLYAWFRQVRPQQSHTGQKHNLFLLSGEFLFRSTAVRKRIDSKKCTNGTGLSVCFRL